MVNFEKSLFISTEALKEQTSLQTLVAEVGMMID